MDTATHTIHHSTPSYPALLKEISDRPESLFARGALPDPEREHIAIVGTRKATTEGKRTARELASELAAQGIVVVSGLAFGIDAAAHEGALDAGGTTVAVLGCGVDATYPREHEGLAARITSHGGCILSEYPAGTPALPHHFLERNRIVSGLSRAVIIVEAPARSGALATARHAALQGREVFVIPGPAHHPNFAGSHALIREGARLVTNVSDVLSDLGYAAPEPTTPTVESENDNPTERKILEALDTSSKPIPIDSIIEMTELPAATVIRTLSLLAIAGRVEEHNGGFMIKKRLQRL